MVDGTCDSLGEFEGIIEGLLLWLGDNDGFWVGSIVGDEDGMSLMK